MKKLLLIVFSSLMLFGCSLNNNTPTKKTEEFLNRYKNLDSEVLSDLELSLSTTGLTKNEHQVKYTNVMKRQYSDMMYKITNETVNGDEAEVEVNISVYDLYKVTREGEKEESQDDKYYNNILDEMLDTDDRVDYTITINLVKRDDKWVVNNLDNETRQKLHGMYNYES